VLPAGDKIGRSIAAIRRSRDVGGPLQDDGAADSGMDDDTCLEDRLLGPRQDRRRSQSPTATTAIEHDGRVLTIISRLSPARDSSVGSQGSTFMTNILGGPIGGAMWQADYWRDCLRNHADAVNKVVEAITSDLDPTE
jgi:hypothetical protein